MGVPTDTDTRDAAPPRERPAERAEPVHNDIPISLKSTLVDARGVPYREFRRGLQPRWWRVWFDLTVAYSVLGATLTGLVIWDPGLPIAVAATIAGALVIGYTLQFINNFFHEASHYNLVPGRGRNDLVANVLMAWLFGASISIQRRIHFEHHRHLGTTMDPENSYFDALRMRYLAASLLGTKVLRSLREDQKALESTGRGVDGGDRFAWILLTAAVNLGIAAAMLVLGSPTAAIAWLAGLLMVFPFVASLRTLLEHRAEDADPDADYTAVDHGAVNRLFGSGPVASTVGSAGFNRHAIHHWEPQVSYTRLRDIEAYLLRTEVAPLIRERQTSYSETFLRLLEL